MPKKIFVETYLPAFPGFYNTIFEPCEEIEIDNIIEIRKEKGLKGKVNFNDDRCIEFDYKQYTLDVSHYAVNYIWGELERIGFVTKIDFQELYSPREYNFSNNSINIKATFSKKNIRNIIRFMIRNLEEFRTYIKERFTSCDGFISWTPNNVEEWGFNMDECTVNSIFFENLYDITRCGIILDFICYVNEIDSYNMYVSICENVSYELTLESHINLTEKHYCEECKEFYKNDIPHCDLKRISIYEKLMGKKPVLDLTMFDDCPICV